MAPGEQVAAEEASRLILDGRATRGLHVRGSLDFSKTNRPFSLPDDLSVWSLKINDQPWLKSLPKRLRCHFLELRNTGIESLPEDIKVQYRLDLQGCRTLQSLPDGLHVGTLNLNGCSALKSLPEGLECSFLNVSGCTRLREFPAMGKIHLGNLIARDCLALSRLPDWLTDLAQLDLRGCGQITSVPPGLEIASWIDVGKSGIRALPSSLDGVEVRWRGVPVSRRVAFEPEQITAREVLAEENVELRRAMIESMGSARFLLEARAEVLDVDRDTSGRERQLLRVPLANDEDLVCVWVICPSTERQYMIRVPPDMKTCHQAVAWTAGFQDAGQYRPIIET